MGHNRQQGDPQQADWDEDKTLRAEQEASGGNKDPWEKGGKGDEITDDKSRTPPSGLGTEVEVRQRERNIKNKTGSSRKWKKTEFLYRKRQLLV